MTLHEAMHARYEREQAAKQAAKQEETDRAVWDAHARFQTAHRNTPGGLKPWMR